MVVYDLYAPAYQNTPGSFPDSQNKVSEERLDGFAGFVLSIKSDPQRPAQAHGILHAMVLTIQEAAVRAAVTVATRFGLASDEPAVLADGANIVVHLRPAPVVAKVAASTPSVRADNQDWLQRELDVSAFLLAEGAPVAPPSPELPPVTHHHDGHVMSFWRYLPPAEPESRPDEQTIGSMLRDLHAALRRYPKTEQYLTPLQDISATLSIVLRCLLTMTLSYLFDKEILATHSSQ